MRAETTDQGSSQGTHGRDFAAGVLIYRHRQRAARLKKEDSVEFLVKLEVSVPEGMPSSALADRYAAEASASAKLAEEGHFLRLWKIDGVADRATAIGLYRVNTESQLEDLLRGLPLYDWMQVTVTPVQPHPHDPALAGASLG